MKKLLVAVVLAFCTFITVFTSGCGIEKLIFQPTPEPTLEPTVIPTEIPGEATLSPEFEARLSKLATYEPFSEPEHYYDEAVTEFMTSEDYGRIYPYIGAVENNYYDGQIRNGLFGFVDEQGRIICDPIFLDVYLEKFEGKSVYLVEGIVKPGADGEGANNGAVLSVDGKFYKEYNEVVRGSYEYIAVRIEEKWGVIDYDGTEVLPFEYVNAPLFSEGLAAVYEEIDGLDYREYEYTKGKLYNYINNKGQKVLGSYTAPNYLNLTELKFKKGLALSYEENLYGFIDKNDDLVIPRIYSYDSYAVYYGNGFNDNGFSVVHMEDEHSKESRYGLIKADGDYIIPLMFDRASYSGEYYIFGTEIYDSNADRVYLDFGKNKKDVSYIQHLENNWFRVDFTDESIFINIKTGEKYKDYESAQDSEYNYFRQIGDHYFAVKDRYGGLLNPDGSWFVKVWLERYRFRWGYRD